MCDSQFSLFDEAELAALDVMMSNVEEELRNGKAYLLLELWFFSTKHGIAIACGLSVWQYVCPWRWKSWQN